MKIRVSSEFSYIHILKRKEIELCHNLETNNIFTFTKRQKGIRFKCLVEPYLISLIIRRKLWESNIQEDLPHSFSTPVAPLSFQSSPKSDSLTYFLCQEIQNCTFIQSQRKWFRFQNGDFLFHFSIFHTRLSSNLPYMDGTLKENNQVSFLGQFLAFPL